ncbi:MAG: hypothetical protein J3Q66DRAFT_346678 [Benniella sp.]|nr:MAG: hypothetical protein J3Q66DRAFT_346678 [Benniella sp.]
MDPFSTQGLQTRIELLEREMRTCHIHKMNNPYYQRAETRPQHPNTKSVEILSIWTISTSYIDYYTNISRRLEGLKDLFESERLSALGYRFSSSQQQQQQQQQLNHHDEQHVSTCSNHSVRSDGSDTSTDPSDHLSASSEDDDNTVIVGVYGVSGFSRKTLGGKCPRKTPTTTQPSQPTQALASPLTTPELLNSTGNVFAPGGEVKTSSSGRSSCYSLASSLRDPSSTPHSPTGSGSRASPHP